MKRFLAHHVIVDGKHYNLLSIVTINDDGSVDIDPFQEEVHSTVYVNYTLVIDTHRQEVYITKENQ